VAEDRADQAGILEQRRFDHLYLSDPLIRTYVKFKLTFVAERYRAADCILDDHPLEELPFADNYFDLAVMINVLDHVRDARQCMENLVSVTKSGGQVFHGSAFFSARNYAMNANDALNNANKSPKPQNKYYYPGGTIGGPVIIPGTNFNKNRDKLFFFAGYEYYYQVLDTGLLRATVPTPGMLQGNFSTSELQKIGDPTHNYNTASGNPAGSACPGTSVSAGNYLPCLNSTGLGWYPGGIIPTADLNANMLALMNLYPAANADPSVTHGYNYVQSEVFNQNNQQFVTRVDYNISDNTKLFVRYNYQRETQLFPVGLWWRRVGPRGGRYRAGG
jgi:hypothetical protein